MEILIEPAGPPSCNRISSVEALSNAGDPSLVLIAGEASCMVVEETISQSSYSSFV